MHLRFLIISCTIALFACNDDELISECEQPPCTDYSTGIFIANEGPFQTGTGRLSHLDAQKTTIQNQIYKTANDGAAIGNILQSLSVHNDRIYLVANNANKVIVVDQSNLQKIGEIELPQPRYFQAINANAAYISFWGEGGQSEGYALVDLTALTVTATYSAGRGAEQMLLHNGKVYLTNQGGFSRDSIVSVINTQTHQVEKEIVVGQNPNAITKDQAGNIWVGCIGYSAEYDPNDPNLIPGQLVKIVEDEVTDVFVTGYGTGAGQLAINNNKKELYFIKGSGFDGAINALNINNGAWETIIEGTFSTLAFDPMDTTILASDVLDFGTSGLLHIYNNAYDLEQTFTTDIGPRFIYVIAEP